MRERHDAAPTIRVRLSDISRSAPTMPLDPDEAVPPANAFPEALRQSSEPESDASYFGRRPLWRNAAIASIARFCAIAVVAAGLALAYVVYFTGPRSQTLSAIKANKNLPAIPQMKLASLDQTIQKAAAPPKIAVTDSNADSNEPLPLGIKVTDEMPDASVTLTGFAEGTTLTAGVSLGSGAWRVAVKDIPWTTVIPPRGYVGQMNIVAEIPGIHGEPAVRDIVRLSWKQVTPPAAAVRIQAHAPTASSAKNTAAGESARHIDPAELAALIKRGEELASSGDISAARLLLQRAAEAHNARAAFELAETYDSTVTGQAGAGGARPDLALAKAWYERARDWGSSGATRQLEALANAKR
jgi:hypothetical protein